MLYIRSEKIVAESVLVRDFKSEGPAFLFDVRNLQGPIRDPRMGLQYILVTVIDPKNYQKILSVFEECGNICGKRGDPRTFFIEYAEKSRILAALEKLRAHGMKTYYWYEGMSAVLY